MSTAAELMTKDPTTIQTDADIGETIKLFLEKKYALLPAVNPAGLPVGFFTEMSLVKIMVIRRGKQKKVDKVGHYGDALEPAVSVHHSANINEIIRAMVQSPSHRVIVCGSTGKLEGILSPKDIIRVLDDEAHGGASSGISGV